MLLLVITMLLLLALNMEFSFTTKIIHNYSNLLPQPSSLFLALSFLVSTQLFNNEGTLGMYTACLPYFQGSLENVMIAIISINV